MSWRSLPSDSLAHEFLAKFRQILRLFALDLTATQGAALTGLNRNTVNRYLTLVRQSIALHCRRESPSSGEVEIDEFYLGARGKTILFGIYSGTGASTRRSYRTARRPASRRSPAAWSS